MAATSFDAIVIGTGQAGPAMADRLARAGMRVAVIERARFGGTCVNTGCIPTKTLVASAAVARAAQRAAEYGVVLDAPARIDMKRVKARKDEVSGRSREGVERWMTGHSRIAVYRGHARFTGPHTVEVNGETLEAGRIFINVGGRPSTRGVAGADVTPHFTSSSIMDVDFVPEHLVIVGGSYIGLEFGHLYRRFGSRVSIVEMGPRLIAREDEDVSAEVQAILEREGVQVHLNAKCLALEPHGGGVAIGVDCAEGAPRIEASHALLAVGRVPNTGDLGLDRAGIATDARGFIQVNDTLETSVPGVWALGDCNGRGAFTHTAYNDYEIVADNLLPAARAGGHDARRSAEGRPQGAGRQAADVARRPRRREGRDAGLHQDHGGRRHAGDPRRRDPGRGRRRGGAHHPADHVRAPALHHAEARHAHPPDRGGARTDGAGGPQTGVGRRSRTTQGEAAGAAAPVVDGRRPLRYLSRFALPAADFPCDFGGVLSGV